MAEMVLSSMAKAKLLGILSKLTFVNNDLAETFRCLACGDLAIYHYFATCNHVLCGKCHSIFHDKPCPIKDCPNNMIEEISQDMEFETGINNLLVHCTYQIYGCTETVSLFKLLDHQRKCKFSIKKLLPKVWKPPMKSKYDEKLEEEVEKLTKTVAEIESAVECLAGKCEKELKNTNTRLEELRRSTEEELKAEIVKLKEELLVDVAIKLTQRFDLQMRDMDDKFATEIDKKIVKEKSSLEQLVQSTASVLFEKSDNNLKERADELAKQLEEKLIVLLDAKSGLTKHQMEKSVKEIVADVNNMKSSNEEQLNRKLEEQKIAMEEIQTALKTKIEENDSSVLAISEKYYKKDEELRKLLMDSETEVQKQLKSFHELFTMKDNSEEDEVKLKKIVAAKVDDLRDYVLGDQSAEINWKISGIDQIVKDWINGGTKEILSKEYHAVVFGSVLQLKLKSNGISSFSIELKLDSYCPNTSRQYPHRRIFSILDQSGSQLKRDIQQSSTTQFGNKPDTDGPETGFQKALLPIAIMFLEGNSRYVKNNRIVLNVVIQPLSTLYKSVRSKDGVLLWTLDNYSRRKKDWQEDITPWEQSPYFYTSEAGYLMHLELRIGKQLLAFFLSFDKGENDDDLALEFCHKATVTILNQSGEVDEDISKVTISKTANEAASYPIGYLPMKTLELPNYLVDDKLLIQLQIEKGLLKS